jgi:hypothetical protein
MPKPTSRCPICGTGIWARNFRSKPEFNCRHCGELLRVRKSRYRSLTHAALILSVAIAFLSKPSAGALFLVVVLLFLPVLTLLSIVTVTFFGIPLEAVPQGGFRSLGDE